MLRWFPLWTLVLFACEPETKDSAGDTGGDVGVDTAEPSETGDTAETADTGPTDDDGDTYSVEGGDCDDANPEVHPGAAEVWYDGVDQDCNGDDGDQDGDGEAKSGFGGTDCNDDDATIFPGAQEVCDGVDQDCDGAVDEDAAAYWFRDTDGDDYGDAEVALEGCEGALGYVTNAEDCDDERSDVNPIADDVCDGKDNDCDDETDEGWETLPWYRDADEDGYGDSDSFIASCYQPAGYAESWMDCDDADPAVNPGADERCDGKDNDCDGEVDPDSATDAGVWYTDTDGDGYGDPASALSACSQPADTTDQGADCDDADAAVSPGALEACNGLDDDCDGEVDEAGSTGEVTWYDDADGDGFGDPTTAVDACEGAPDQVADATDCDDVEAAVNPAATESCNGVDDDCDGGTDVGLTTTWHEDVDGDGYGDAATAMDACSPSAGWVVDGSDCDDVDAAVNPGAVEVCDDVDDDCDGATTAAGTATYWDSAGVRTDVSALLASGTPAAPVVIGDAPTADLVVDGGVLTLCDGTWYGQLVLAKVATELTVQGQGGAALTTLTTAASSGGPTGSVVAVTNATLTLQGLTIADGNGASGLAGGGIVVSRSLGYGVLPSTPNVTLLDSVVTGNTTRYGGGVAVYGYAWVDLVDSVVSGNEATSRGGGFWVQNYGELSCAASSLGAAGVVGNTAPVGGGGYLSLTTTGTVDSVGCDWGADASGDDNSVYDLQQAPGATDFYCYGNAAALTDTVSCTGGACTASTDTTCP